MLFRENGQTPSSRPAENGHEAVVKLLLERSAGLEAKGNDGRTPLSFAAEKGCEGAIRLLHQDNSIRWEAVRALGKRLALFDGMLKAIAAQLEDQNKYVRWEAVEVLGKQPALKDSILKAIVARLGNQDDSVRQAAVEALIRGVLWASIRLYASIGFFELMLALMEIC